MPALALSMIVRDAEATLARCLESARGVADEVVIADTGSNDRTMEIARELGARVFSIPWENDFAAARNRALEEVHADWVLVLDADELLDPAAAPVIRALIAKPGADGYLVSIRNYVGSLSDRLWDQPAKPNDSPLEATRPYPAYVEHENVRLFHCSPKIHFTGRVHETVGSTLVEGGGKLGRATFTIHHFGLAADAATRARKNHLYRELGRRKIEETPGNAQAHFELGLVEFDNFHNDAEALKLFLRACELNPQLAVAWVFAGLVQLRLGNPAAAFERLRRAESLGYRTALVVESQGDACYNLGDFEAARKFYRRALERSEGSVALESKLGLAEVRAGRVGAGLDRMRQAIGQSPALGELHDRVITACVWLGRLEAAAAAAEQKLCATDPQPESFLRAASIRGKLNDYSRAAWLLRQGLVPFPDDAKLRLCLAEAEARAGPSPTISRPTASAQN
jgi:Flp pilus assembly protein TadD